MGISTIASYRNSHLFETVGLDPEVASRFFEGASHHLAGKTLDGLLDDAIIRHRLAFEQESSVPVRALAPEAGANLNILTAELRDAGLYRYRHGGEEHSTSPELVRRFHAFVRTPSAEKYREYTAYLKERREVNVRDLLELRPVPPALGDQEVEPHDTIISRFSTQAMSLGAISKETHRILAIAMNRLGARSNTGEGGEDAHIYSDDPEANNKVKQVASARFGVTANYLVHAEELEIKIAQGAKPGEGGQLPPSKVSVYIARLRHAAPGMALISPPPHHDIYSIEDLAQLIHD
jgi:glutamate synthase domain-containing protein 2